MKSNVKTLLGLCALTLALMPFGIGSRAEGVGKSLRVFLSSAGQTKRRPRIVEPNERYVVLNKKGERTREYGPGEEMPDDGSCVEIKCPRNIKDAGRGKSVRCWRCGQD